MDLVNSAVGLKQAQVFGQVQIAVAKKVLDAQRQGGAAALELLNAATEGINKAGDALAASATGVGGNVDVYG